ncbi:MAG: 1-acyl-sn-glycerol-3-phosphate acyltransferase [Chloroflexi bacterium]|nr:1-acyl-sn-glycerol-3-phosphate acyltransferase [Chloroflexota bacterium]
MSRTAEAREIVQRQTHYQWRRRFLRDWLLRPLGFTLIARPHVTGRDQIPPEGPTLLIMNHIAFVDPVIVSGVVTSRFVIPMSKIENFRHPIIGLVARLWGAIPVDRNRIDRRALQNSLDLLTAGHCLLVAPEGTRHHQLQPAKEGFTYLASRTGATVVPVGLENTDRVRGFPRRAVYVRFGAPFRFKVGGRAKIPRDEMYTMTQEAMYRLAALVNEERRGAYQDLSAATTATLEFLSSSGVAEGTPKATP